MTLHGIWPFTVVSLYMWSSFTATLYCIIPPGFSWLLAVIFLAGFIRSRPESGAVRVRDHWLSASVRPAALSAPSGRPPVPHPAALHQPEHTLRTQDQVCSLQLYQSVQSCSILISKCPLYSSYSFSTPLQFQWVCKSMQSTVLLMIKLLSIYL